MAPTQVQATPGLTTFLKSLKQQDVEKAIETFVSLLKRRQIRNSRPCAIATAQLLLRVVASAKVRDPTALLERVRKVGRKLVAAQPREMAVGNIVRRVLGLIREVVEDGADSTGAFSDVDQVVAPKQGNDSLKGPALSSHISQFSPLNHGASIPEELPVQHESRSASISPVDGAFKAEIPIRPSMQTTATGTGMTSLFGLLSTPDRGSPTQTPPAGASSPTIKSLQTPREIANFPDTKVDVKAEVIDGIKELLDELDVVDDQIAAYALEHIHNNEIILTHTSSQTIQRFLLTAARKRKFTVVHVEAYPNDHAATHETIMRGHKKSDGDGGDDDADERWKPLTAMGITVIMIPDSAVFALMSRVNKVILAPHSVLANGSLIAAAGAQTIAQAAKVHQTPVVVLSGVYKLSPVYPFDTEDLIEYGDPGKVVGFEDGEVVEGVEVLNPIFDYVESEAVGLYITNLGGHAPSYLYRIVADHYRVEDINLS
ncbi:putative translation initiation factor eIF-2B subunit beta [Elsinoe australis]|uniref:Translation initiation factor eIF2B subunit beta n=1 Tax=Elsinoe australis TaxID=40998 RepID=A0A4U7AQG4_9PEZI|nr:putative translation initiation factor eIF-2B subunit beta [Elsinoe australis]